MAAVAAVVVVAVALQVASTNLSRFVEANRPRLEAALRAELGRTVTTGPVELSLLHGPGVRVRDVRIADEPRFGGDVLRAEEVVVTVRLLPALLGRYQVRSIRVAAPVVTLLRDDTGWNVSPAPSPEATHAAAQPAASAAPAAALRGPPIVPWPCVVRDGTVRVVDRRTTPARELVLEDVDASVSGAVRDRPIVADVTAGIVGSPGARIRLAGSLGPVSDLAALSTAPLDGSVALRAIDVQTIRGATALLDLAWPRRLLAAGPVSLEAHATGTMDTVALRASLDATPAEVRWRRYLAKPGGLALEAALDGARDGDVFVVRSARLRLGGDELTGEGTVRGGTPPTIDLRVAGGTASLASLAHVVPVAEGLEVAGTGEGRATLRGAASHGRSPGVDGAIVLHDVRVARGGESLGLRGLGAEEVQVRGRLKDRAPGRRGGLGRGVRRGGLAGSVRVDVRQGVLIGLNVVEQILSLGTGIPGVANLLPRALREARPALFGGRDASFRELGATIRLDGGRRRIRDLVFRGDGYTVTGRGAVDRDGRLALTATLLADAALTADVIAVAGPARLLTNDDGLLELPVSITGRPPALRIGPGRGLVGRVLERALGGRRQPEQEPSPDYGGVMEDALRRLHDLFAR
jgi:hypothetical protein